MPASGAPLGLYPAGYGAPVPGVDAPSGPPVISRLIDSTGDYQIDPATGQYAGMPPTRQRVMIALGSEFGSSAVLPELGVVAPAVIDVTFVRAMQANVRSAVRQLTTERVIRIRDIRVTSGSPAGRSAVVFEYEDLTLPQSSPSRKATVDIPIVTP